MKTAIQELEDKLKDNLKWIVMNADYELMDKLFKEALEKEKEQIMKAYEDGADHGMDVIEDGLDYIHSTQYYNETYK